MKPVRQVKFLQKVEQSKAEIWGMLNWFRLLVNGKHILWSG